MKFRLVLLFFIQLALISLTFAGGRSSVYNQPDYILINDSIACNHYYPNCCYGEGDSSVISQGQGWIGSIYQESITTQISFINTGFEEGDVYTSEICNIYVYPGDSVQISDYYGNFSQVIYSATNIADTTQGATGCVVELYNYFKIIVQNMPDSLQQSYLLTHFGQQYIDSMREAAIKDSVKTLDSLTTIQNIQSGKQGIIYPNPTAGLLNFTNYYPSNGTAGVEIFDVSGREVIQQNFAFSPGLQTNAIDMGNLPNGVYLVQYTVNGNKKMEKVVKM